MERFRIAEGVNRIYPLGITASEGAVHVCVAAKGSVCRLLLFEAGKQEPVQILEFPDKYRIGDVFRMTVKGDDFTGLEYCFQVDGVTFSDPYGASYSGRERWGDLEAYDKVLRCPVLQEGFDWEGDEPLHIPYEESVIYRTHVRGFTRHSSSGVKEKGTFKAFQERIPYLKDLGITTVELLPVNEFQELIMPSPVEGNPYGVEKPTGKLNYWGYAPGYLFAPKASFASGRRKEPVKEFKDLIKALHKEGIELVMELYFTGSESPSNVLDALRFWVEEYHVDGIHLVGFPPVLLVGTDPYLSKTKLWATSWEGTHGGTDKHLGEYHDGFMVDMRRVLKGDEDEMNNLIFRSKRNPKTCGVINYIANTNGFTMMDMVSYDTKHNEANGENNQDGNAYNFSWNCGVEGSTRKKKILDLRKKQLRNAMLLLFLSQGTPLILAGDEFGNSKGGNNNTYCQDNEISWLNWNQLKSNRDIYEFTRHVIAFRKAHPVFSMKEEPRVMDYMACGHPDVSYHGVKAWCPEFENFRRQLGIMYCGSYGKRKDGSEDNSFFVALNMHWEAHEFDLPNLSRGQQWHVAYNTDEGDKNGIYSQGQEPVVESKQFVVPPRTIVVFMGIGDSAPEQKKKKTEKPGDLHHKYQRSSPDVL